MLRIDDKSFIVFSKDEFTNYVEGLSLSDFMGYFKIWFYYNDYIILCQALSIILYNYFYNVSRGTFLIPL